MRRILTILAILCAALPLKAAAESRYVLITVLHTNDQHGRVMPDADAGGLARAATMVHQIRADMPNVVLLDAGDTIHGTPEVYLTGGLAIISAMNALGYQAATVGNHEFDFGLPVLERVLETANFPMLGANVEAAAGGRWKSIQPHIMLEIEGVRIAVLGLATTQSISLQWPNSIRDIRVSDPIESARKWVPELRQQADVVIVLSHLGVILDRQLAEAVDGIDFIVGGHSHTAIRDWTWVGDTMITQTGAYNRALGRFDFIVRKDEGGAEIVSVNGRHSLWADSPNPALGKQYPRQPLIPLDDTVATDPEVEQVYMVFKALADETLDVVLGQADAELLAERAGDFTADAVREITGADIAIIDAPSAVNGLATGELRARHAFGVIGGYTRQYLVTAEFSGEDLLKAVNGDLTRRGKPTLAFSGLEVQGAFRDGVPQVESLVVDGRPVESDARYTVAAQAYVMMDLMQHAQDMKILSEPGTTTTREALIEYVRKHGGVIDPGQGRYRMVEEPLLVQ